MGEACILPLPHLVLVTQPPAQPTLRVLHHQLVDLDHRTQTEVVGPTIQHLVELPHFSLGVPQTRASIRPLADRAAQLPDLFQRGPWPHVGPARLTRVMTPER